ncbi:MAG: MFS transporter [Gammaproteobacteria bacterium]
MSETIPKPGPARDIYDLLTGDEDARVCRDIADDACREQPRNYLIHVASLVATKTGDRLAGPKLVLAWLMTGLGAPAWMLGWLVPIRESLALLPQLAVARYLRAVPVRKWFWVAGSVAQGIAVALMGIVALRLEGAAAGWAILGLLTVFSLARGVCSVASKDVLGKTIAKTRRGSVSGYAASAAGAVTVAVGVAAIVFDFGSRDTGFFAVMLLAAGALWLIAAFIYSFLAEYAGATEGGGNALSEALRQLELIRRDADLREFLITRTLLLSTALAAPFYVSLANESMDNALSGLGSLMIASGAASFLSAPVWGRLSDRSSRLVMKRAALLAAAAGLATAALALLPASAMLSLGFALTYFLLSIAHAGVRLGRKTHLVDIATSENRASYVAVSNTVIGVMLAAGGIFGTLASLLGSAWTLVILSLLSVAAAASAHRLSEAQE